MSILLPLLDIARDQRLALDCTEKSIDSLQIIIDDNPLYACPKCDNPGVYSNKLHDGKDMSYTATIRCPNCKLQTQPAIYHPKHIESIRGALLDIIQIWNGHAK